MIALGSIAIGSLAAMALVWAMATEGFCRPPYTGPRIAPDRQRHVTRFRP